MKIIITPVNDHRGRSLGFSLVYIEIEGKPPIELGTFDHDDGAEIEVDVSLDEQPIEPTVEIQ